MTKIGALFFSDNVELYIPPAKGKGHILRIIRELLTISPKGRGTNIGAGLEYFLRVMRKKSVAFLMSDLLGSGRLYDFTQTRKPKTWTW